MRRHTRHRVRRTVAAGTGRALVMALLALVLAGCASEEVELEGTPEAALADAVDGLAGTLRVRIHASFDAELFVATQAAEGIVEPDGDTQFSVATGFEYAEGFEDLGSVASLDRLSGTVETISTGGVTYTRASTDEPPPEQPELPPGVEWVADEGAASPSLLGVGGARHLQPRTVLAQLQAAGDVEDHGVSEVDGTPIRWLKAEAGDTAAPAVVPPGTVLDVALDDEGRLRRLAYEVTDAEGGKVRVIIDVVDRDVDETVAPPPSDATVDRSALEGASPAP